MIVNPLCLDCIENTGAHTAVACDPSARCVVCGNDKPCKPAGPRDVNAAFRVYFERLEMVKHRAQQRP